MLEARHLKTLRVYSLSKDGICKCGDPDCSNTAKHPAEQRGVYSAKINSKSYFAGYNVGIACGDTSLEDTYLIVLDVDPRNGGHTQLSILEEANSSLPFTWKAKTPSGGFHLYFSTNKKFRSTVIGNGIDVQSFSKYVVAPPSVNEKGFYQWEISPHEQEIAELPEWLEEFLLEKDEFDPTVAGKELTTNEEWDKIKRRLSIIDADDYKTWIDCGMALHNCDRDDAFQVWDEWSKTSEKYKSKICKQKWKSFKDIEGITANTIFKYADEVDGGEPDEEFKNMLDRMLERHHKKQKDLLKQSSIKVVEKMEIRNKDLPMPSTNSFLYELMKEFNDRSLLRINSFSLTSAVATFGALFQDKYSIPLDGKTSGYFIMLAPAGFGKNDYIRNSEKLIHQLEARTILNEPASNRGLSRSLVEYNSRYFIKDEFINWLDDLTYNRHGPQSGIINFILQLWSQIERLQGFDNKKKEESSDAVFNPYLSILGTGTEAGFKELLIRPSFMKSGLISRFEITMPDVYADEMVKKKTGSFDKKLIDEIKKLFPKKRLFDAKTGVSNTYVRNIQPWTEECENEWFLYSNKLLKLSRNMSHHEIDSNASEANLVVRLAEKALRYAAVHSLTIPGKASIDLEDLEFGVKLAEFYKDPMKGVLSNFAGESEEHILVKKILFFIQENRSVTKTEITKRFQSDTMARMKALKTIEDGELAIVSKPKKGKAGRPKVIYTHKPV